MRMALLTLFLVCLVDLLWCPHSKVEESFPLQATHDIFYHGLTPAWRHVFLRERGGHYNNNDENGHDVLLPYDHIAYPGVVPRSFIGPLVLATLCRMTQILVWPMVDIALQPTLVQFLARFFLLLLYLQAWYRLAAALNRQQAGVGTYALWITASQFHLTFYASRLLPNVFATVVCLHAWAYWVNRRVPAAAACLVVATAVFRCDVLLLLATAGLAWLVGGQLTVGRALRIGILVGTAALVVTVPVDSLLWQRWVWPEGQVFWYNTVLGRSANWGTSPWYWYLTSALPKAILLPILLVPLGITRILDQWFALLDDTTTTQSTPSAPPGLSSLSWWDLTWMPYFATAAGFVALYSCLGHKEVRFLFPALPLINAMAAAGLARLHRLAFPHVKKEEEEELRRGGKRRLQWLRRLMYWAGVGLLMLSFGASAVFVAVSRRNYPGGVALARLADRLRQQKPPKSDSPPPCHIYIDNAAAMTGVPLFGQRSLMSMSSCTFVKAGYEAEHAKVPSADDILGDLSHAITEDASFGGASGNLVVMERTPGNPVFNWRKARIDTTDALYILEKI